MYKNRISKTWNVVLIILGVLLIAGIFMGLFGSDSKVDKDGKVEINPSFEVGGLTAYGKYDDVEDRLYTKEAFKCKGLQIKVDFDADIEYEIYFYDEDENFISKTEATDSAYKEDVPETAVYARIVIVPEFDTDDVEPSINLVEKLEYVKQIQIKVDNNQEKTVEDTETTTE